MCVSCLACSRSGALYKKKTHAEKKSHSYRIFVNGKVGEGVGGNILAFSITSVDFSLGGPNDNVASLASQSEMVSKLANTAQLLDSYLPERSSEDSAPVRRNGQITFHDDGGGRPASWSRHGGRGAVVSL